MARTVGSAETARAAMRSVSGMRRTLAPIAVARAVAGFQAVARGVGGIVAVHFLDVLDARLIAHQIRQRAQQLDAILGEQPLAGIQHLIHEHPAADAVVVRGSGAREAGGGEDVAHLVGDGGFVGAAREGVGREVDGVDFLAGGSAEVLSSERAMISRASSRGGVRRVTYSR